MKHRGFPSGSPPPPPSPRTLDSVPLPHLNLLPPICLQLKNQFVRCFSLCSAVASSFNLQGHLNPHKSKHSNQTSPLFKMSCHRWGTNRTPWLIGQFKRKMAKTENDISRERPLRQRHGDATVALSSCYGKGFPFNTCFIELFYLENPLSLTNGVWKVRVRMSLASVQFTKIGKAPPKNKMDSSPHTENTATSLLRTGFSCSVFSVFFPK